MPSTAGHVARHDSIAHRGAVGPPSMAEPVQVVDGATALCLRNSRRWLGEIDGRCFGVLLRLREDQRAFFVWRFVRLP